MNEDNNHIWKDRLKSIGIILLFILGFLVFDWIMGPVDETEYIENEDMYEDARVPY